MALCLFNRFASYVGWIQPIRWLCVLYHFYVQSSIIPGQFQVFAISALWLRAYLTNSLHVQHKYNPWRTMCWASFLGQKVKVSSVFDVFAMSTPCLRDRCTSYLATNITYEVMVFCSPFLGRRSRSHRLFDVFALSAPWFYAYLTD